MGVDYFGSLTSPFVWEQGTEKVAIFTCAVVGANHLEVVDDLLAKRRTALERFAAFREVPETITSDHSSLA